MYRMRPLRPEFDWFEGNKHNGVLLYDSGEKLAEFDGDGGRWYYRNGRLALEYHGNADIDGQQRIVIHSSGDIDERGRSYPITVLASFDHLGGGLVFDHNGKIRLKYNHSEGVVLDRKLGPVRHWRWHNLNDLSDLRHVAAKSQLYHEEKICHASPATVVELGSDDEEKETENNDLEIIELENSWEEENKIDSRLYQPLEIKMKALKINEQFTLKIINQASIYIIFKEGSTLLKLNVGTEMEDLEIIGSRAAMEEASSLEHLQITDSSEELLEKEIDLRHLKQTNGQAGLHVDRSRALDRTNDSSNTFGCRKLHCPNLYYDHTPDTPYKIVVMTAT